MGVLVVPIHQLDLGAVAYSPTGYHTISFQILDQSKDVVGYVAEATVVITRDGLSLGGVTGNLGPTHDRLRPGDKVSFPIELYD